MHCLGVSVLARGCARRSDGKDIEAAEARARWGACAHVHTFLTVVIFVEWVGLPLGALERFQGDGAVAQPGYAAQ